MAQQLAQRDALGTLVGGAELEQVGRHGHVQVDQPRSVELHNAAGPVSIHFRQSAGAGAERGSQDAQWAAVEFAVVGY
jgi:hypothetical protein